MHVTARRLGLIAVAAALAAGLAAVARRSRPSEPAAPDLEWRCACGAVYRVTGADRHRVYWPEDAPEGAPVLGDACVRCGAELPAGHDTAAT